jgi:hypothetical protein
MRRVWHCDPALLGISSVAANRRLIAVDIMHSVTVIDDCGIEVDLDNPALARRLGTSRCRDSLLEYLVINLGFVACEERRRSLRIRFRPSIVTKRALGGLATRLQSRPFDRVLITSFDDDWFDELFPSAELALKHLTDLMVESHYKRASTFQFQDVPEHHLPQAGAVAAILEHWRNKSAHLGIERVIPILYGGFDHKFLLVEHLPDNDELIIQALGCGYSIFDKTWCKEAPGERLEDQYDVYYGRWAAQGYRTAASRATPIIQTIDAVIDRPSSGYRREQYARVIVPFRQNGRTVLLSASTTNLAMVTRR